MTSRRALLRLALFTAGVGLVAWMVRAAGAARVFNTVVDAGRWLPLVVALEGAIIATDFFAARALVGPGARVGASRWAGATLMAYASSILLPSGRAAGEATRASLLSPAVGWARAVSACSRLQAVVLFGNAVACLAIALAITGARDVTVLRLALAGNAVLCTAIGAALVLVLRDRRFRRWVAARFPRLAPWNMANDFAPAGRATAAAIAFAVLGRGVQAVQYGVVVRAVAGVVTPASALTAQGIHLVGATLGDAIPNQMGATEGAFRAFARALHLETVPARALSIALIVRTAQLAMTTSCLLVWLLLPREPRPAAAR